MYISLYPVFKVLYFTVSSWQIITLPTAMKNIPYSITNSFSFHTLLCLLSQLAQTCANKKLSLHETSE